MNVVVGATGMLGGEICRLLAEGGKPVRALVRRTSDPAKVDRLRTLGAEIVEGDLKDRASLARACEGATAVVSTATVIVSAQEGDSFERTDKRGHLDLIDVAEEVGAQRFVFLSFGELPLAFPFQDAKRAVEERLRASPLAWTILRPGLFPEIWLGPAMGWHLAAGRARVWGEGDGRQNFIAVRDVARVAVRALDDPRAANAVVEFAAEHMSWNDAVRQVEQATGRSLDVERVPLEALQAQQQGAASPHEQTFAAMGVAMAHGDPVDRTAELRRWLEQPTRVVEAIQA